MSQGLLPCFVDSAKEESRGDNATAVAPLEPPLFQGENNPTVEVTGDYSPELFAIPFIQLPARINSAVYRRDRHSTGAMGDPSPLVLQNKTQ